MKKKREKLFCDTVCDDNQHWLNRIHKVTNDKELVSIVYEEILKKTLDDGAPPEKVVEYAQRAMLDNRNMEMFTKLMCVNNYYYGGKQVYKFDDTLSELLVNQTKSDLSIGFEALEQLPVQNFYVLRNTPSDIESDGFFFSCVENMVYISDISKSGRNRIYTIRIAENKTIAETLSDDVIAEYGIEIKIKSEQELKRYADELAEYFQFVLYLSAINAEITPVTKGAIIKRQAGKREYKHTEHSELSEVGYRIGAAIRKSVSDNKVKIVYEGEHTKGSPKSPHIRRSHFHSFWTGSGDNKELKVKWLNTIFVHGNNEGQDSSTIHKVE